MTKKHFVWAARYIANLSIDHCEEVAERDRAARAFIALFQMFGQRFDRARFVLACGLPSNFV